MKRWMMVALLLLVLPAASLAVEVAEGVITTAVVERAPVDVLESYPAEAGTLFCYTRIAGAVDETSVTHVWIKDGREMGRVALPVRSSSWRTWSSKKILPGWSGSWQVDVLDAEGNLLTTLPFRLY